MSRPDREAGRAKPPADLHQAPGVARRDNARSRRRSPETGELGLQDGARHRWLEERIDPRTAAALVGAGEKPEPQPRNGTQHRQGRILHPLGVLGASVFVAGVLVGADSMSRALGVPTYIADVIVAASLLAVLVATLLTQYRIRIR